MPELSYGSHFFQDMVESDIFYAAVFDGYPEVSYNPEYVMDRKNLLGEIAPNSLGLEDVIRVADVSEMELYSDIISQKVLCK
jgi:hypothetical protein